MHIVTDNRTYMIQHERENVVDNWIQILQYHTHIDKKYPSMMEKEFIEVKEKGNLNAITNSTITFLKQFTSKIPKWKKKIISKIQSIQQSQLEQEEVSDINWDCIVSDVTLITDIREIVEPVAPEVVKDMIDRYTSLYEELQKKVQDRYQNVGHTQLVYENSPLPSLNDNLLTGSGRLVREQRRNFNFNNLRRLNSEPSIGKMGEQWKTTKAPSIQTSPSGSNVPGLKISTSRQKNLDNRSTLSGSTLNFSTLLPEDDIKLDYGRSFSLYRKPKGLSFLSNVDLSQKETNVPNIENQEAPQLTLSDEDLNEKFVLTLPPENDKGNNPGSNN